MTVETDESGNAKPGTAQPSYNAGTYTWVQWDGGTIAPFGRSVVNNYDFTGLAGQTATWPTYMQVYKVNPIVSLTLDKTDETVRRGDVVTATFTIENTYDNVEGLPTADQVSFVATYDAVGGRAGQTSDTGAAVADAAGTNALQPNSPVQKNGNVYTQSFVVTEDTSATSITITATTSAAATNYNEGSASQTLNLPAVHGITYQFVSADGSALPAEVSALLPTDAQKYEDGIEIVAKAPSSAEVKDASGDTWTFRGWDAEKKTVAGEDLVFTGTWERAAKPNPAPEPPHDGPHGGASNTERLPQTSDDTDVQAMLAVAAAGLLAALLGIAGKGMRAFRQ